MDNTDYGTEEVCCDGYKPPRFIATSLGVFEYVGDYEYHAYLEGLRLGLRATEHVLSSYWELEDAQGWYQGYQDGCGMRISRGVVSDCIRPVQAHPTHVHPQQMSFKTDPNWNLLP